MEHKDIFSTQSAKNAGMTVPEGFFDDFNKRMAAALPAQEWENPEQHVNILPRSRWQKVRTYVYMAAMFMGIWCMMKMFDIMRAPNSPADLNANQTLISALNNDSFYYDYCVSDISDTEIYDDLYDQGVDPSEFSAE